MTTADVNKKNEKINLVSILAHSNTEVILVFDIVRSFVHDIE